MYSTIHRYFKVEPNYTDKYCTFTMCVTNVPLYWMYYICDIVN